MKDLILKTCVSYTDTEENKFAIELWKLIKDKVKIKVCNDFYSTVDYELTSKDTDKIAYLELKCRNIKYSNCSNFIIGETKLKNILKKSLTPCILIWKFESLIFFIEYKPEFLNYPITKIKNASVINIPKNDCGIGMADLTELIRNILL